MRSTGRGKIWFWKRARRMKRRVLSAEQFEIKILVPDPCFASQEGRNQSAQKCEYARVKALKGACAVTRMHPRGHLHTRVRGLPRTQVRSAARSDARAGTAHTGPEPIARTWAERKLQTRSPALLTTLLRLKLRGGGRTPGAPHRARNSTEGPRARLPAPNASLSPALHPRHQRSTPARLLPAARVLSAVFATLLLQWSDPSKACFSTSVPRDASNPTSISPNRQLTM
eukprot:6200550-Pleurochrysis_carterae.AAC.2